MTTRDYTAAELLSLFPDSHPLVCPICRSTKFQKGPSGGHATNYRCENGHCWNVHALGMDYLSTERKKRL